MKTLFNCTIFLVAILQSAGAQQKVTPVKDLIASKHFAFVVTEIKSLPIFTNSYSDNSYVGSNYPMNLSFVAQTEILGGRASNYDQSNFGAGQVLPSYYSLYGIEQYPKTKDRYNKKEGEGVYIVQLPDGVLVSGDKTPTDFRDIIDNDFFAYQQKDIKSEVKSSGDKWQITYTLGIGKDKRKFEMNISRNGLAVLKTEPVGDKRYYLYGRIVDSQSLQFNKE